MHNTETKVSLWKVPEDVQAVIDTMPPEDEATKELKAKKKLASDTDGLKQEVSEPRGIKRLAPAALETEGKDGTGAADINEEEEDEEDEEGEEEEEGSEDEHDAHGNKRLKTGEAVEFTEDDVAWQLEAMAEEYGFEEDDFEEGEDMIAEDNINSFKVCD